MTERSCGVVFKFPRFSPLRAAFREEKHASSDARITTAVIPDVLRTR